MKLFTPFALACAGALACPLPAAAHPGGVDANGCHYERSTGKNWQDTYHCHEHKPANRDTNAAVKKSRENVCHDKSSSNYSTIKYFVAYKTMAECQSSGGKSPR